VEQMVKQLSATARIPLASSFSWFFQSNILIILHQLLFSHLY
jgi:hypothetical protein